MPATAISAEEYIQWVKGSLNRLLGAQLSDDAVITSEYRAWIVTLQINQHLPSNGSVDEATQNAIIRLNRFDSDYVRWLRKCLRASGEGAAIAPSGGWDEDLHDAVKEFQINEEGPGLNVDGFVGAKTETALIRRTGFKPPGVFDFPKRVDPVTPRRKPDPGWEFLDAEARMKNWSVRWYNAILTNGKLLPNASQRKTIQCMLNKIKTGDTGYDLRYLTRDKLRAYVHGKGAGTFDGGAPIESALSNGRTELLSQMRFFQRKPSQKEAYEAFQSYILTWQNSIGLGLNLLQSMANDDVDGHFKPVRQLRFWVEKQQNSAHSVLSCFAL